jgi:hypothetical protein
MTLHTLELNDTAISLYRDTNLLVESPGIAVLDGAKVYMGREAQNRARVLPRHLNNQFWSQLNLDVMPQALGQWMRHADIAHAHLQAICKQANDPEQIILAVPGCYQSSQLALLLGMARECSFKAVGLIDAALAATITVNTHQRRLVHLDLLLHQAIITQFEVVDNRLRRTGVVPVPGLGLLSLYDGWARYIAAECIRQTRFDPKYKAKCEQTLYNALPGWLNQLDQESELTVELQGHPFRLNRKQLLESAEASYRTLLTPLKPNDTAVVLSHRVAMLPGFSEWLDQPIRLAKDALTHGIASARQAIVSENEDLAFVTALPQLHSITNTNSNTNSNLRPKTTNNAVRLNGDKTIQVTHLLWKHKAYPLDFSQASDLGQGCEAFWVATQVPSGKTGLKLDHDKSIACRIVRNGEHLRLLIEKGSERYFAVHQLTHAETDQWRLNRGDTIRITGDRDEMTLIQVEVNSSRGKVKWK